MLSTQARHFTVILALLGVFPLSATARQDPKPRIQNPQPDPLAVLEKFIEEKRMELNVPGVAVAIVREDRVIFARGYRLRDVEEKLPVTPNTLFAIGSCTKAFTAVTVLISAEEGKLALTDSPKKYLPYFKLRDPEADGKITIGDLLCHRSGLDRTDLAWYMGRLRPEEVIRVAGLAKPMAKLGEKLQYQNVMYLVAGEIVGKVQKKPWGKFLAERIFRPLGMSSSNISVSEMQRASDYAHGYTLSPTTKHPIPLPIKDLSNIAPAGAINSNAKEMAQWIRLMLNGGVFAGKRLLSEESFQELWTERGKLMGTISYGYGWMLNDWNG
ncbi:MAG TPA: serine hydrolase domain-containing protein, partial [Chthonomonadales bacterium]|nr:serine hydrolase domain-containing protein [Chthonomonadales bacterium]